MKFLKVPERDGMWSVNYFCDDNCSEYHFLAMTDDETKANILLKALNPPVEETFVSHVRG